MPRRGGGRSRRGRTGQDRRHRRSLRGYGCGRGTRGTCGTRRALLGEEHPDTAQSHNNLALALLNTGDRSWARRHFEKALTGFEALGPEYSSDLEAVASNYCNFLREEGENSQADLIAGRVRDLLGPATV